MDDEYTYFELDDLIKKIGEEIMKSEVHQETKANDERRKYADYWRTGSESVEKRSSLPHDDYPLRDSSTATKYWEEASKQTPVPSPHKKYWEEVSKQASVSSLHEDYWQGAAKETPTPSLHEDYWQEAAKETSLDEYAMESVYADDRKKVFSDDDGIYTMVNMGEYVGSYSQQFMQSSGDYWKLLFFEKQLHGKTSFSIDSLVDSDGEYIKFVLNEANVMRTILLKHGYVIGDYLHLQETKSDGAKDLKTFTATDSDSEGYSPQLLEQYLESTHPFVSYTGEVYHGAVPSNVEIYKFLEKDRQLTSMLERQQGYSR